MIKYYISIILLFSSMTYGDIVKDDKHLFVISGVIVNSANSEKINNFIKMIERKSNYPLKPFFVDSYSRLSQVLRDNPDSLAWTCGAPYVEDHIKDKQQLIVVPLFNEQPSYSSFIVSRKKAPGSKLLDFKNKVFVYSDPRSNSGYVAPSMLLINQGQDINTFFRVKVKAGSHEKSIEAIYRGLADVGAIDEYIWQTYTASRPRIRDKLHVIEKIGPFPFTPIVAGSAVNQKTINKIQNALVHMNAIELNEFKRNFQMDGFVIKNSQFYQPIKKMMINTGISLPNNGQ